MKDEKKPSGVKALLTLLGITLYIFAAIGSLSYMIRAIKALGDLRSILDIAILMVGGSLLLKVSE